MLSSTDKERFRIMGMSLPLFVCVASVVFGTAYMDALPRGMVGAFPLMMLMGRYSTKSVTKHRLSRTISVEDLSS
ncbi:MAG: hypothetical protein MI724_12915 [Spirochaetales bacterium]|nr:hypothetical protein [Spirochaetales bacterium]